MGVVCVCNPLPPSLVHAFTLLVLGTTMILCSIPFHYFSPVFPSPPILDSLVCCWFLEIKSHSSIPLHHSIPVFHSTIPFHHSTPLIPDSPCVYVCVCLCACMRMCVCVCMYVHVCLCELPQPGHRKTINSFLGWPCLDRPPSQTLTAAAAGTNRKSTLNTKNAGHNASLLQL